MKEQIKLAEEEIAYFDQLIQQLSSASPKDITEIREELAEGKYLRAKQQGGQKKQKKQAPTLEAYESSSGETILVGKNNKQNEYLTMKLAARDHIWLHTKDIPGSHVVIQSTDPDEQTILEAAQIAAYYSKAKKLRFGSRRLYKNTPRQKTEWRKTGVCHLRQPANRFCNT